MPVVRVNSPIDIRVEWSQGLYLALTPTSSVAGHTFNLTLDERPGVLPRIASATPRPYTELQSTSLEVLTGFLKTGWPLGMELELVRIGILADARMIESEAPPGIVRYIGDLERAVRNKLTMAEGSMVAELRRDAEGRDQCHHTCTRNALDRPDDLGIRLDWQRVWQPIKRAKPADLIDHVTGVIGDANRYFEQFGSGEM